MTPFSHLPTDVQAIIFDMDGVIVDSEPLNDHHQREFLLTLGVPKSQTFKGNLKGMNSHETWKILIEAFNLDYEARDLVDRSRKSYLNYLNSLPEIPVIPGAIDLISYVSKKGYRLALASSASPKRIELFLQKLQLESYFEVIVTGDDIKFSKPAPDVFLLAASQLSVSPDQCVVVEDAENGVQAAKSAGIYCVAYAGSEHNTDDLSAADLVISDFKSLTSFF